MCGLGSLYYQSTCVPKGALCEYAGSGFGWHMARFLLVWRQEGCVGWGHYITKAPVCQTVPYINILKVALWLAHGLFFLAEWRQRGWGWDIGTLIGSTSLWVL